MKEIAIKMSIEGECEFVDGAEAEEYQQVAFEKYDAVTGGAISYDTDTYAAKVEEGMYILAWVFVSNEELETWKKANLSS